MKSADSNDVQYIVRALQCFLLWLWLLLKMKIKANKPEVCQSLFLLSMLTQWRMMCEDRTDHLSGFFHRYQSLLTATHTYQVSELPATYSLYTVLLSRPNSPAKQAGESLLSPVEGTCNVSRLNEALDLRLLPCFHSALSTSGAPQGGWSERKVVVWKHGSSLGGRELGPGSVESSEIHLPTLLNLYLVGLNTNRNVKKEIYDFR